MNSDNTSERILSSWKEIAACFGKGVRTVQRWEKQGLPVHRPYGSDGNVVMAVESELRAWMNQYPESKNDGRTSDPNCRIKLLKEELQRLGSRIGILDERLRLVSSKLGRNGQIQERAVSVLAVDDNDIHRYTIGKLLSASGFDTLLAKNGTEALSLTATSKPDVILLDVMLPDMSGFEVCDSLRSESSTKDIPIVFHTAIAANEVNCTRALSAGACAFITYPIDRENLVTIINGCVMRDAA
jgi:CheY-like chemotaxis protein